MNINPEKIKRLIFSFSELNDEYQDKLMMEAFRLQLRQNQEEKIKEEGMQFTFESDLQKEIDNRMNESAEHMLNMIQRLEKMDDTGRAFMFLMLDQISEKGIDTSESDITITINQKNLSMEEFLAKSLPNMDYKKAKKMAEDAQSDLRISDGNS